MNQKIKILSNLFLKLDYRDKENSGKKKITGIIISYLVANALISLNLYFTFDKQSFIILSFSTGIFLLSFIVLNDYSNLFFSKQYIETLRTLPLRADEVFISKFFSAFVFVLLIQSTIVIPQAVIFYFYDYNLTNTFVFIIADFLSNLFIAGIILIIYSLALYYILNKANILIYILQFIFFVYIMYASSLTSKAMKSGKVNLTEYGFIKYFPQYYFSLSVGNYSILALCVAACFIVLGLYYLFLRKRYYILAEKIFAIRDKIKSRRNIKIISNINDFIYNKILRNNLERASYSLIKNQIQNSRVLKLRFIPPVFIPLVITLIGILADIPSYLYFAPDKVNIFHSANNVLILGPSIVITLVMCIRIIITNAKIADENSPDISWIYDTMPVYSIKYMQNGIFKFIYINLVAPVIIVIFVLLSFKINLIPLLLNFAFIISATFFLNSLISIFDRKMPFSLEATKYNSASRFGEIMLTALAGIVIIVGQIFIFENVIFVIISVAVFLIISILLNRNKN